MAKYKVAFDNNGFKDKKVDNVNRVQASSDLLIMRDDKGEVLFAAPMNQIRYVEMIQPEAATTEQSNVFEVYMSEPDKPPVIKVNGEVVKGIMSVEYKYETSTLDSFGQHNCNVVYITEEAKHTVGVGRVFEGKHSN